jgi:transcriptional regulator with XRE-family HTH domain
MECLRVFHHVGLFRSWLRKTLMLLARLWIHDQQGEGAMANGIPQDVLDTTFSQSWPVARAMGIVDHSDAGVSEEGSLTTTPRPLHRLAMVRHLQGLSHRTLARRMNVSVLEIRQQEEETTDPPLSVIYEWQKALGVPIAELLVESDDSLSQSLVRRAQLVRVMKTALALLEKARSNAMRAMAQNLVDQLIEIMPELQGIGAWKAVGKRRTVDDLGVTALRTISADVFLDGID